MDPFWSAVTAVATVVYTLATIALVFVTIANVNLVGRYTKTTERMVGEAKATSAAQSLAVEEMRRAREAEIRPILVPFAEATELIAHQMIWGVKNVGKGPALRIDVRLGYGGRWWRRLRAPVIMPGEARYVPDPQNPQKRDTQYSDIREGPLQLAGSYHDVAGVQIDANGEVPFVDEWTSLARENLRAMVDRQFEELEAEKPPDGGIASG